MNIQQMMKQAQQDLIVAAINDAQRKVDEAVAGKMGGMMGGLNIPGLNG